MEAFYERMDRGRLLEEAKALGFPMALLGLALASYAGPRLLTMHGRTAKELYPKKGIVAGCPLATTLVKVYYARAFDDLVQRIPKEIELDVFLDDIDMTMEGEKEQVVEGLARAHEELRITVTEALKGRIAEAKTMVAGSSREVTRNLCRR